MLVGIPNCNRLYVGLGASKEMMAEYVVGKICPACEAVLARRREEDYWKGPILEPFIIAPTFMKQFDNAHIQMIWHNAYMDLARADKVVFVGYSLPEADYHLRTLLKRAIRPQTQIDIVLVDADKPPDDPKYNAIRNKFAAQRYESFFGQGPKVKFHYGGVQGYFRSVLARPLDEHIAELRAQVGSGNP